MENERKPRRERLTLMRLFEALRIQGYEGGYDAVRRHARRGQREEVGRSATALVPPSFDPGQAYQFDWSHELVVLVGGMGSGKTHPSIAIARNRIRGGVRVRFYTTADLVNRLEPEAHQGRTGKLAEHLSRLDLLILDELGYLPVARTGGQLLAHRAGYLNRFPLTLRTPRT